MCVSNHTQCVFLFVFPSDTLVLTGNLLAGPIPASIGQLTNLESKLGLSWNLLSGAIPASIGDLVGLVELWMYQNKVCHAMRCYRYNYLSECQYLNLTSFAISPCIIFHSAHRPHS